MTYRSPLIVLYEGQEHELLKDSTWQLPMEELLGIESNVESATINIYNPTYRIDSGLLILESLAVLYIFEKEEELESLPTINGVRPLGRLPFIVYQDINFKLPYTGTIVIGRDHKDQPSSPFRRYEHDYLILFQLSFSEGVLQEAKDISLPPDSLTSNRL
jgi:hypothetical protein